MVAEKCWRGIAANKKKQVPIYRFENNDRKDRARVLVQVNVLPKNCGVKRLRIE